MYVPHERSPTYLNGIMIPEVAAQEQVAGDHPFKCGVSKVVGLDITCTELIDFGSLKGTNSPKFSSPKYLFVLIRQSFPHQNPFCTYSPKFYPARILRRTVLIVCYIYLEWHY